MRFAFIAPRFHTNFYFMVKTLLDHGHTVDFLVLYQGVSEDHGLVKPIVLGYSPLFRLWNRLANPAGGKLIKNNFELRYGWPRLFKFCRELWRLSPEVLVIKDIATAYSLLALIVGRLTGRKMVVLLQIPKYRLQKQSGAVKWLWRLFRVSALTPVLGDRSFSNNNPNLIYSPFVYPALQQPRKYFANGMINILCVGKFQERKNQLLLVKALEHLPQADISLTLIGQDDELVYTKKLKDYISNSSLDNRVRIMTNIKWAEMGRWYEQNDILVLPSYAEAASCSVLEAMAHGLAVISSDHNGTACYVEPGINGEVFHSQDLGDLSGKLETLVRDRQRLKQMGEASLALVAERHRPETFYQTLMRAISPCR